MEKGCFRRSAGGSVRIYSLFQESLRKKRISVHRNGARDTAAVRRNLYDRGIKNPLEIRCSACGTRQSLTLSIKFISAGTAGRK